MLIIFATDHWPSQDSLSLWSWSLVTPPPLQVIIIAPCYADTLPPASHDQLSWPHAQMIINVAFVWTVGVSESEIDICDWRWWVCWWWLGRFINKEASLNTMQHVKCYFLCACSVKCHCPRPGFTISIALVVLEDQVVCWSRGLRKLTDVCGGWYVRLQVTGTTTHCCCCLPVYLGIIVKLTSPSLLSPGSPRIE